jgi:GDPmannose 4,6-dehydratase
VQEFLEEAFAYADLDWKEYVEVDPRYFRPTEVEHLLADASRAREKLGWEPKVTFHDLVKIMVDADMAVVGLEPRGEGKRILGQKEFAGWHHWDASVDPLLSNVRSGNE